MKMVSKWSEKLEPGDEFKIGNSLVIVESSTLNTYGQVIVQLCIVNPKIAKNKCTMIIPKGVPIETLQ